MKMNLLIGLIMLAALFTGCSSASKEKITISEINSESHRIIYGKIKDMNPASIPEKLQLTYVTSKEAATGMLAFDNKYPYQEPKSEFFWVKIPKNATYFGIRSIRFALENMDGSATIRDDKDHLPLFGIDLPKGNAPVYIGEINIMSGTRKYGVGFAAESFDLKQAYIKNDAADAKDFLTRNGYEATEFVVLPFKLKTTQEASKNNRSTRKL